MYHTYHNMPIKPWIKKSLLANIELSGEAREKVNLCFICDSNKSIFGDKASNKRRLIQSWWRDIKKKQSIKSYAQLLDRYQVPYMEKGRSGNFE